MTRRRANVVSFAQQGALCIIFMGAVVSHAHADPPTGETKAILDLAAVGVASVLEDPADTGRKQLIARACQYRQ